MHPGRLQLYQTFRWNIKILLITRIEQLHIYASGGRGRRLLFLLVRCLDSRKNSAIIIEMLNLLTLAAPLHG